MIGAVIGRIALIGNRCNALSESKLYAKRKLAYLLEFSVTAYQSVAI